MVQAVTQPVAAGWLCCVSSSADSVQVRHVPYEQEVLGKLCQHELHRLHVQCKSTATDCRNFKNMWGMVLERVQRVIFAFSTLL